MHHRILDFSLRGLRLCVRLKQLKVFDGEKELASIPLSDIAVVILVNPQISLSQSVLSGIAEEGGVAVICNQKSLPISLCTPLIGHHLQTNRIAAQIAVPKPVGKRLWQQIVRKKIQFQADLLVKLFQDDAGLNELVKEVRSGDTENREGVAAKRYWGRLFGGTGFKRLYDGEDRINISLNYGYAVLRAAVARAIAAAGLHPSIGIFHHNKYNPYPLADDLIEIFRPVVDYAVFRLYDAGLLTDELTPAAKKVIIDELTGRYIIDGNQETLFETASKIAESLCRVYEGRDEKLTLPTSLPLRDGLLSSAKEEKGESEG